MCQMGSDKLCLYVGKQCCNLGATNRKLVHADLRMSLGYGAKEEGKLSCALLVVLQKGPIHKDRHGKDDQVAVGRHKNYKLCAIFSMAAHILWPVKKDSTINFLHSDKNKRASWWDKEIVDVQNSDGEYNTIVWCNIFRNSQLTLPFYKIMMQ